MVTSLNVGTQCKAQQMRILIMDTPRKCYLNFGSTHVMLTGKVPIYHYETSWNEATFKRPSVGINICKPRDSKLDEAAKAFSQEKPIINP